MFLATTDETKVTSLPASSSKTPGNTQGTDALLDGAPKALRYDQCLEMRKGDSQDEDLQTHHPGGSIAMSNKSGRLARSTLNDEHQNSLFSSKENSTGGGWTDNDNIPIARVMHRSHQTPQRPLVNIENIDQLQKLDKLMKSPVPEIQETIQALQFKIQLRKNELEKEKEQLVEECNQTIKNRQDKEKRLVQGRNELKAINLKRKELEKEIKEGENAVKRLRDGEKYLQKRIRATQKAIWK